MNLFYPISFPIAIDILKNISEKGDSLLLVFPHVIPHKKAGPEFPKALNLKLGNILYR